MTKSFTDREREVIGQKLIESCEECWNRFGYKKTSVSQICEKAGISTGAFYLFYPSKELLFVETAQRVSERFFALAAQDLPPNPTKYDCAKVIKRIASEVKKSEWLLHLSSDLEIFARKLPSNFFDMIKVDDVTDLSHLITKYSLRPTVPMNEAVGIIRMLMSPLLHYKRRGEVEFDRCFEFIVDSTVERLFE